ncbi:hypothetical protein B0F90DRAFT_1787686 [Multifurca ochricompacta]|uniref:Uncharacterized protein n=1 Tax=Multifurca ochricompacta TaxID=376703 RepID=A0AAD4LUW1_9AGAM|nr:hypothetical protein B0F90DRAFT_1787686 [Multifurca ochricompacta]
MTAPTQQLPSWLSLSTSLATNAAGQPTATFTTLLTLPLTYFGPSVSFFPYFSNTSSGARDCPLYYPQGRDCQSLRACTQPCC